MLTSIREAVWGNRRRAPQPPNDGGPDPQSDPNRPRPHLIEIENRLDSMPGADHLNWRTSIVDLLTLIGVDSSVEAREALAGELGYDGPLDGSRDMDNWLHTRVLAQLEDRGGTIPPEFE
jgi:hypothetical protein